MDWEKDVTICCLKQGEKYGPDWVNRLYRMVQNTGQLIGFSFVCFTDDTEGIDPWIQTEPLPYDALGWWGKMGLYMPALPGVETRRILYLDLDVVITGDLHKMLELKTDFAIMRDYPSAQFGDNTFTGRQGNTSVILLTVGSHTEIWDGYMDELIGERKYLHWGDQEWLNMRFPESLTGSRRNGYRAINCIFYRMSFRRSAWSWRSMENLSRVTVKVGLKSCGGNLNEG